MSKAEILAFRVLAEGLEQGGKHAGLTPQDR